MKKYLNKSMAEFVLDQKQLLEQLKNWNDALYYFFKIIYYANVLSETPELCHFIPCDENDVPLEKPIEYSGMDSDALYTVEQYQQACDRVLFEGCKVLEYNGKVAYIECGNQLFGIGFKKGKIKTFEDLIKHNLPLTDNGAKFFGYDRPQ